MPNCPLIFIYIYIAFVGNFARKRQGETDIKRGQEGEISQHRSKSNKFRRGAK
jgi:hypothetical protein